MDSTLVQQVPGSNPPIVLAEGVLAKLAWFTPDRRSKPGCRVGKHHRQQRHGTTHSFIFGVWQDTEKPVFAQDAQIGQDAKRHSMCGVPTEGGSQQVGLFEQPVSMRKWSAVYTILHLGV